jgi:sensor c-di-GMP phosphodiesterase-like protein
MQDQQQNVLAARVTVTMTAALGAAAGLLLGCVVAIPLAENRLETYLDRVAIQDDASRSEARSLLDTLRHSASPACSDAELNTLRELVYRSDYLKDAGRVRGGRVECSATAGRPVRPIGEFKSGQAQADGTVIFGNLAPTQDQSLRRTGIQRGDVFVVFGSHLPELGGRLPIRWAVEPYPAAATASSGAASSAPTSDAPSDEVGRRGGTIFASHCSAIMSNCVVASMDVDDARRVESTIIGATTVAGGIAGIFLGIALCGIHRRSLTLHQQLKHALAHEQLHLAYQPIVNLATGKIVGAEALARWTRPDGVVVSPGDFIKSAEKHGFIGSLTNLVLRRALKEFSEVLDKLPDFRLNINIAAADLMDPLFLPMIAEAVEKAKVRPSSLTLEVTETSAANHEDALESIRVLRRMGFGISIDDFGTGYSNLSYLLYLSADSIKIDKAFTRTIGTDAVSAGILPQIIAMARTMNLAVVVEGIESPSQADYFPTDKLRIFGQGWLYGRPVPAGEFFSLIGVTVDQPGVAASPEAAEIPGGWRQLEPEVGTATIQ